MPVRHRLVFILFVGWTAFVWSNRISNTLRSDESVAAKTFSTVLSIVLLVFAAGELLVLVRSWRRGLRDPGAKFSMAAAVVTIVVWLVRVPQILLADHSVGFEVVHSALGVVSFVLAVAVLRICTAARRALRPQPPI